MNNLNRDPEYLVKIGTYINSKINKIEAFVATFFIIAIVIQQLLNLSLFSVIAGLLLILAMAYFFSALKSLPEDLNSGINRFILKILGYGSSVAVIGILFTFGGWSGYEISLNSAGIILIVNIIAILFMKFIKNDDQIITKRIVLRISILAVITAILFFTPVNQLVDFGIMNQPI